MKILHINVRLQEGGAARIALDLHRKLQDIGFESRFAYGWGEKGGPSSAENLYEGCFQVGQRLQVAGNMMIHKISGIDVIPPLGSKRNALRTALHWADIVHLHAIHSYFLPFEWLVNELLEAGKPIAWTAHDYWLITGRCAFTEGCEGWRKGCGSCPTQNNYPPAILDMSSNQFQSKRKLLAKLESLIHVVAPTVFVAETLQIALPKLNIKVVPNWIDGDFETAAASINLSEEPMCLSTDKTKVLIIANDLSDSGKIDHTLVEELIQMPHIEIHTIGQKSPFSGSNVINHGRVLNRSHLVELIASNQVALFTSKKDTFGLVMIEALACGIPVLALESPASKEVLGAMGLSAISEISGIVQILQEQELPIHYEKMNRKSLHLATLEKFGKSNSIKKYREIYQTAIGEDKANENRFIKDIQ